MATPLRSCTGAGFRRFWGRDVGRDSTGRFVKREEFRLPFEVTRLEEGEFEGVAAVFGSLVESWVPTIVERGAFERTIREDKDRIKILWQHDPRLPIGRPTLLEETDKGLRIRGKISQTEAGRDALTLMRDGVVTELSIGFDPVKWRMEQAPEQTEARRHLDEVRLWEVSPVTFAADPEARVTEVHASYHAVVAFQDLALADDARRWDAAAAERRVRTWAGGADDLEDMDWPKYRRAFVWYDAQNSQQIGAYKLLIADVLDETLTAVPRGIFAAAVVVQGGRGGLKVPAEDLPKIRGHLARYYKKMDRTPPWEQDAAQDLREALEGVASLPVRIDPATGAVLLAEEHIGRVLSKKNANTIRETIRLLTELLKLAKTDDDEGDGEGAGSHPDKKKKPKMDADMAAAVTAEARVREAEVALLEAMLAGTS